MLYVEMTPAQRKAKADDLREAIEVHIMAFARRPFSGSYDDRRCMAHKESAKRELAFLTRVARSRGDAWAKL
jgi:hypothetical protein